MVSIVIPNYNGNNYLDRCLQSINVNNTLVQEVIIIDNYSRDGEYNWVKKKYPYIIWKQLNKNYGFSKAVNKGIHMARGKYILLLNNDTEIYEDFIEELVRSIENDERIFAVCSQMIQYYHQNLIDDAGDEYTILGYTNKRGAGGPLNRYNKEEKVFSACAGAALYRKSIFEEIGYFDEHFFAYMEDVDISYRALIHGYKNMYCPEAKVLHIGSATSGSKYNAFKVRLAARNNIYVPYKNMPFLQLIINMPFLLLGYLIKYIFFIKKGFGKEYREGLLEGLRTLKKINKVKFKWKNIVNYFYIEWLLVKNTLSYIGMKVFNR
ncbi:glycosyltransferase family 2 protein [Zhenhengia yiwuensis]|uniref:Glycosyltransferase family 2 protein n=1 Tax=Zhenhengia yiwuensis TaxID=2763666 RepID=A0A926EH98_9FIRM|nr:glycosyltransferase family 2 protein [Zhenhengia yiwuensis]MBC8578935.1 glycosyltransferase family 2 protein [Zhenhengia yiwuensis]